MGINGVYTFPFLIIGFPPLITDPVLMNHLPSLPPRLDTVDMQSPRIPGRKRGRPPLHSTPMKMAVHNLYSASAGSLPVVKIPKKRGRKPGYKVCDLSHSFDIPFCLFA